MAEIRSDLFVAQFVGDNMEWGLGNIVPIKGNEGTLPELAKTALSCIEKVGSSELRYSCCADGRRPEHLLTGEQAPVREALVGDDAIVGFWMAEALGRSFYGDPTAPVEDRLEEVFDFLHESGFDVCTHLACGMATHLLAVKQNAIKLHETVPAFNERNRLFIPSDVFDQKIADGLMNDEKKRLSANLYEGYSPEMVVRLVQAAAYSGNYAVTELRDDKRGVHGHVEELIVRIGREINGYAVNEQRLFDTTNGREVFSSNDSRVERLARAFSRGGRDLDYVKAYIAGEQATNAGHATLSRGLPTIAITKLA